MELTTDQALQQGVAAHKEGKLQDAERLYRAILQSQPTHPDANHNLGVLAVSFNNNHAALPLFKTALEANPQIEQFWLSYIDALIKEQHFDNAKHVLEQAKNQGMDGDRLNSLEAQLSPKTQKPNTASGSPAQELLHSLLGYYQNGRFGAAEKLSVAITKAFPKHQFAWKVLGAVLGATDRKHEAVDATRTSVALSPKDAEARNNLGNMLKKIGRFDEAEASYKQAIVLKPAFSEAHYNLGITFQELGRLDEAEASYNQAIALKNDYAKAHYNLGITLQELGRLDEAEASYNQAVALEPDYAEAHGNLGNVLKALGRLDEAEANFLQAIALKPDYANAHFNLANTLQKLGRLEEAEASYTQAIALKSDYAEVHYNLGITLHELGRLKAAEASYTQAIALKPSFAEAHGNLGNVLKELGRLYEAEASYNKAIALKPEDLSTHNQLLMCLFLQDNKSVFFEELDYLINQDQASAIIGSLVSRSSLKYGLEKPNLFCSKPLNYVLHNDMNTRYDFKKIFVKKARSILNENRISNRRQSLLVNGNQTLGNIFDIVEDTAEIQNIIRLEVEKYREKFKKSEEGFIKKMPTEYSLYGWLISMKSGGNLKPHIHTEGWLSGSIYINVPQKLQVGCGNLVVSLGEENDVIDTRINEKKTINVVTGSLVFFPASLTHYTIPFESEEERVVLAFDVREK